MIVLHSAVVVLCDFVLSETQRPRVDRFIMPRDSLTEMRRRSWLADCDPQPVDIWHTKYQQQRKYKSYLDEALGLKPSRSQGSRSTKEAYWVQPWPCVPRKKCFLSPADSILDLPTYSYASFPELIDWSSKNVLVAALGRYYHKYSWRAQSVTGQGFTMYDSQCCKFDPHGDLLLIGTEMKAVELHPTTRSKYVIPGRRECSCTALCSITSVDWSPTGNSFVIGCSRGVITTFDRNALPINTWRGLTRTPVLAVRVSPDSRYVAAATVNSPSVHVLVWPSLEYHSSLNSNWIVKTITWHPWRSALLGVGAVTSSLQTTIAIWDTPSSRLRETDLGHNHYTLDAMLFSHRTGELVLSLWNSDRASAFPKTSSQLVVMSDPHTVVDQSQGEGRSSLDRVRTMVFSPDGTKLATATADEDLIIWNFLPEEKNKKKNTKSKRFFAIPAYLDELTYGFVLR